MAKKEKKSKEPTRAATKKEVIVARLRVIERRHGRLTAEAVVEDAQSPDSPLHSEFEWNDVKAAHSQRLDTARRLIANVIYTFRTTKHTIESIYYIRDADAAPEQGYVSVTKLQNDPAHARRCLDLDLTQALGRLEHSRQFARVIGLEEVFEEAIRDMMGLRERIAAD